MILDNLKVHHSKKLLEPWLEENKDKIELFYIPSYSPELNPDEYFNGTLKRKLERCGDSTNLEKFKKNVHNTSIKIQNDKQLVSNLYHAEKILYAALAL
ncbi:hypothetical protein FACS1894217_15630 [Clostridia bacterium]|nr:hypothetical protein FACS1894217_15630 [Clostridia bacterium]